jgi:D-alanine-D-alanine ligase
MKVAVLMGGRSAEREISLRTGRGIARALRVLGHEVTALDAATGRLLPSGDEEAGAPPAAEVASLPAQMGAALSQAEPLADADVVFVALHGGEGEDGTIRRCSISRASPTPARRARGARSRWTRRCRSDCSNTGACRRRAGCWSRAARATEIDTRRARRLSARGETERRWFEHGDLGGERPGRTARGDRSRRALRPDVLIEQYIPGRELTVAVMGDEALPIVEIRPKSGNYDYESKYTAGRSEYFCPADLPEPLAARIRQLGVESCRVLGCRGVARVDFRLDPQNEPWCLEVNTVPGMTPTSLVPMAAKARGLSYDDVVQRMLELAVTDWQRRHGRTPTPGESARA